MALLTRIGQGGVGKTYGTITDKAESAPPSAPDDLLTRIAVGGTGQTYGVVTDKTESDVVSPRPGDLFTRIGVGGVGIHYDITAKAETEIEIDLHTPGYYGVDGIIQKRNKEEDEIIALIMAMYETIH